MAQEPLPDGWPELVERWGHLYDKPRPKRSVRDLANEARVLGIEGFTARKLDRVSRAHRLLKRMLREKPEPEPAIIYPPAPPPIFGLTLLGWLKPAHAASLVPELVALVHQYPDHPEAQRMREEIVVLKKMAAGR